MSRRLEVLLGSGVVGDLSESANGEVQFRFHKDYLEEVPRPVLGQRFEDDLETLRDAWDRMGSELPLPAEHAHRLREHWQKVPVLREAGGLPAPAGADEIL